MLFDIAKKNNRVKPNGTYFIETEYVCDVDVFPFGFQVKLD